MTIALIIIAVGIFIFLAEVGEGLKNYLSQKGDKHEPEQPDTGFSASERRT